MYIYIYIYMYIHIYIYIYIMVSIYLSIYIYIVLYTQVLSLKAEFWPGLRVTGSLSKSTVARDFAAATWNRINLPPPFMPRPFGSLRFKPPPCWGRVNLSISTLRYRWRYGRFSTAHAANLLPDPGALNSCMRTSEKNMDVQWLDT